MPDRKPKKHNQPIVIKENIEREINCSSIQNWAYFLYQALYQYSLHQAKSILLCIALSVGLIIKVILFHNYVESGGQIEQ